MEEEFEESNIPILADNEIVEKGTCDLGKHLIDINEPSSSLMQYFEYLQGDKIARCKDCIMRKII
uniref:Uncharacterized protein n=1 Tax=Meloidogyne incognita TaxID=6306 RepID=A0A914MYI8_MELIC